VRQGLVARHVRCAAQWHGALAAVAIAGHGRLLLVLWHVTIVYKLIAITI